MRGSDLQRLWILELSNTNFKRYLVFNILNEIQGTIKNMTKE